MFQYTSPTTFQSESRYGVLTTYTVDEELFSRLPAFPQVLHTYDDVLVNGIPLQKWVIGSYPITWQKHFLNGDSTDYRTTNLIVVHPLLAKFFAHPNLYAKLVRGKPTAVLKVPNPINQSFFITTRSLEEARQLVIEYFLRTGLLSTEHYLRLPDLSPSAPFTTKASTKLAEVVKIYNCTLNQS